MDTHKPSHSRADQGQDLVLELNFVPAWARQPAGKNPYGDHAGDRRAARPRRDNRTDQRRGREPARGGPRRRDRAPRQGPDHRRPRPESQAPKQLPVTIQFLPDRDKLGLLVREVRRGGRAYPMMNLASLFIHSPDHYLVKLQAKPAHNSSNPHTFYQCKQCQTVAMDRARLEEHILSAHLNEFYESETVDAGPPAGNFVCVCRCRLSGTLLGPPNYHGYKQKVEEMLASRFSNMSMDAYQRQIETVHDADLVEQWKSENRMRHLYRVKTSGNADSAEDSPAMDAAQAGAHFREHHLSGLVHECTRAILPAVVAQRMEDRDLKAMIREAWTKESRFPLSLSLAMRPAFRHMRLYLFKTDRKHVFVTPIKPKPLDPGITIDSIRDELNHLEGHPGCTRQDLVDALCPGAAIDSAEVAEVISNLRWLVEKGHVIEFHNGTLALPVSLRTEKSRRATTRPGSSARP